MGNTKSYNNRSNNDHGVGTTGVTAVMRMVEDTHEIDPNRFGRAGTTGTPINVMCWIEEHTRVTSKRYACMGNRQKKIT